MNEAKQPASRTVPRLTGLAPQELRRELATRREPVVIGDAVRSWPAMDWTFEALKAAAGDSVVSVRKHLDRFPRGYFLNDPDAPVVTEQMTFKDYLSTVEAASDDPPYYLSGISLKDRLPALQKDVFEPPFLSPKGDASQQVWIGAKGTVAALHYDVWDGFLGQVMGRKRVLLFDRRQSSAVYPESAFSHAPYMSKVFVDNPDRTRFPRFETATGWEVELKAGDGLFIPAGWWHQVWTLEPSVSVNFWWKFKPYFLSFGFLRLLPFALRHNRRHQQAQGRPGAR